MDANKFLLREMLPNKIKSLASYCCSIRVYTTNEAKLNIVTCQNIDSEDDNLGVKLSLYMILILKCNNLFYIILLLHTQIKKE